MRKLYFVAVFGLLSLAVKAQVVNFEDLILPADSFWNGSDQTGGFNSGNAHFPNSFVDWGGGMTSWSGFAYSNMLDTVTQSFTNQYSCYAGIQTANSTVFAMSFNSIDWMTNQVIPNTMTFNETVSIQSIDVTNTTYAALTMLNGDMYSKKFGGQTGNDPDWFKLTIIGFNDSVYKGSVEFYLADYRFSNNDSDYIVKQWTTVDLSSLGEINSLSFTLNSSDTGMYGMNTPAYFCFDNIRYQAGSSVKPIFASSFMAFPNPANDYVWFNKTAENICIYSINGEKLAEYQNAQKIDISGLTSGIYLLEINHQQRVKLIKR